MKLQTLMSEILHRITLPLSSNSIISNSALTVNTSLQRAKRLVEEVRCSVTFNGSMVLALDEVSHVTCLKQ